MLNPIATYRLQFHKNFTFNDLDRIIPYLKELGVSTIYASPVFEATIGSTHGYDSVNPHQINPEIGTLEQLKTIRKSLKHQGIYWLQDIVPNHMAYSPENTWLMDVLEKGPLSVYEKVFDLPRTGEFYKGRIMVPFLGAPLDEVIEDGELKVVYEKQRLVFKYYHSTWPLNILSYDIILKTGPEKPSEHIRELLEQISLVHQIEDPKGFSLAMDEFRIQFASLTKDSGSNKYLNSCLQTINSQKHLVQQLADHQLYRLCHWLETDTEINYRRFFTVNGLICLNVQDKEAFRYFHQFIRSLLDEGIFDGLRIDHIDGLYDPADYLEQLRELAEDETYIVVEKILKPGEELPENWPVQGNTGYDFLAIVNNLFTLKDSEQSFSRFYHKLIEDNTPLQQQIREKKAFILYQHMGGELENLCRFFVELTLADEEALNAVSPDELKLAIAEFLISCPVYRYYGNHFPLEGAEAAAIQKIFQNIREEKENLKTAVAVLETALIKKPRQNDIEYNQKATDFYQRCMQFTGPLMAKGVEDTLMYTYNRFISHNEVGGSPETFGLSAEEFHEKMIIRQSNWPLSINTTSTHDTKRGEDVRARLNVLTELADEWLQIVKEWQQLNCELKKNNAPDANDEYFIYQTLIGVYPMPGQSHDNFSFRIQEYLEKALREAKQHSNWTTPNEEYEKAAKTFTLALLDKNSRFHESFENFHRKIVDFGIINSLSQLILKFTCPGVPDIYQGCELWDLSLVDPDNRGAVDFKVRQSWLENIRAHANEPEEFVQMLWQNRYEGPIKLWLTHLLLTERKQNAELFEKGNYIALEIEGRYKEHVLAFARRYQQTWYVVAVPLHLAVLSKSQKNGLSELNWEDTRIILPPDAPQDWEHVLFNSQAKQQNGITLNTIFKNIPLAVLKLRQPASNRSAGILMHITSLPSAFGTGDFGPEAKAFARFLSRSSQKFWQLLPLNPTEPENGYSPYSSYSSMAGNTLLISPELLADEGLLDRKELPQFHLKFKGKADFKEAERIRNYLFEVTWNNFKNGQHSGLAEQFDTFCRKESFWLDDFALYVVLKQYERAPWYEWPNEYKLRNHAKLDEFVKKNTEALDKIKWQQYLFSEQWKALKNYCHELGVQLFGDLPFYVNYDSVDVWSNPEIFSLDEQGRMKGVAGVPPDYFNENGQLWGMPVFCWDKLKEQNYDWWIQRIKKNLELYDLLRLDHFRAFSAYWEVSADEKTAINGRWVNGPGEQFFKILKEQFGDLPFVAEDLGDINDAVYQLREEFGLPGMKVLQFAFGDNMPESTYTPHNFTPDYLVYTGTHDNNTTAGWYNEEAGKLIRKQIRQYTGLKVTKRNIHQILGRLAYSSVANTVILPVQDICGLDQNARMNTPASVEGNWLWRLRPGKLTASHEKRLKEWVRIYNRLAVSC